MHARMMHLTVQPDKMDEALRTIQDSVGPVLRQQQGFKNWLLMSDANQNKIISITVWETMADLTEGEMSEVYQAQAAKVVQLLTDPPVVEDFKVDLQT